MANSQVSVAARLTKSPPPWPARPPPVEPGDQPQSLRHGACSGGRNQAHCGYGNASDSITISSARVHNSVKPQTDNWMEAVCVCAAGGGNDGQHEDPTRYLPMGCCSHLAGPAAGGGQAGVVLRRGGAGAPSQISWLAWRLRHGKAACPLRGGLQSLRPCRKCGLGHILSGSVNWTNLFLIYDRRATSAGRHPLWCLWSGILHFISDSVGHILSLFVTDRPRVGIRAHRIAKTWAALNWTRLVRHARTEHAAALPHGGPLVFRRPFTEGAHYCLFAAFPANAWRITLGQTL